MVIFVMVMVEKTFATLAITTTAVPDLATDAD